MSRLAPLRMEHVDVGRPLYPLTADAGGRGIYIVFWCAGMPLGHCSVVAEQLPLDTGQVAVMAAAAIGHSVGDRLFGTGFKLPVASCGWPPPGAPPDFVTLATTTTPLAELRERSTDPPASHHSVSVVVCTRDRPDSLRRCLDSLAGMTSAPSEILVVDNAPDRPGARGVVDTYPGIVYVAEARPGLSIARNTGVARSTGDIVAFTDDDATVHPAWLDRLVACFDRPEVMGATGIVLPANLDTESEVAFEQALGGLNRGYQAVTYGKEFFVAGLAHSVPVWEIGAGANMAIRRAAFDTVGTFDERLGAGAAGCSEDSELWYRLLAQGHLCCYTPDAVVFHSHRSDMKGVEDQAYQYMKGHTAALWVQFGRHHHWGNVRRATIRIPTHLLLRALHELPFRPRFERRLLVASVAGYLAGLGTLPSALHSSKSDHD